MRETCPHETGGSSDPRKREVGGRVSLFDAEELVLNEKAGFSNLSHIIGSKDEEVRFLPDLSKKSIEKDARRHFTEREKWALIEEDGQAVNTTKLDIAGTHYETQSVAEIAMAIMPLKGLS